MRFIDLSGNKFGRLTVLSPIKNKHGHYSWKCRCECGNVSVVTGCSLSTGSARSCGCLRRDTTRIVRTTHGESSQGKRTSEYRTWISMKRRCDNRNCREYKNYGGRGIQVCKRWSLSFELFLHDMGRRPPGLLLERINNDGHYEPGNVRWATRSEQMRNTRLSRAERVELGRVNAMKRWHPQSSIPA